MNIETSVTCREAQKSDLPSVLRLLSQPGLDDGKTLPLAEAEHYFERFASYPDYKLYVALHSGRVVGTFALLVMDNLAHLGAPSAIVEDVVVDPALGRQGIGRQMMQHAMQLGRSKGCYKLVLSSNLKREQAHAFYESLGFERHGYSYRIDFN